MARMYSRRKGSSGSKKPIKKVPTWSTHKGKDVEKLVVKFAKSGKNTSEIGMILRDSYGVPSVKAATEKTVTAILAEHELNGVLPEDLLSLIRKLISVKAHFEKNKHDQTAKRGITLAESKIRRLVKYYKSTGRLSADWQLDMERIKMYAS